MVNLSYIAENAFMNMLVSSIESFPTEYMSKEPDEKVNKRLQKQEGEIYGLLFGQKINKANNTIVYNVSLAIPMHIFKEKTPGSVVIANSHFDRIKTVVETYPMYQFLGTFHSHPYPKNEWGPSSWQFSKDADMPCALNDADQIEDDVLMVILALTNLGRNEKGAPVPNWASISNYCGRFKYVLTAYVTDRNKRSLEPVDNILCPSCVGIGNQDLGIK